MAVSPRVYVWDRFVRIFHWSLVLAFVAAFLTEDGPELLHIGAGALVAALVLARIAWGFVGPEHARFRDFVFRPAVALRYLRDLLLLRAERYLGHSPAGGVSVLLLLASLLATSASGVLLLGADQGWGPLTGPARVEAPASRNEDGDGGESAAVEAAEEIHEGLANLTLALVTLHLAGVLLASFVHHENLAGAMLTGFKRP